MRKLKTITLNVTQERHGIARIRTHSLLLSTNGTAFYMCEHAEATQEYGSNKDRDSQKFCL
jgi:hypothetical protein